MAIRVIPAAPATPTSPRPPSTGAIPPAPRAPRAPAAPPPITLLATPLTARRAKPPATTGKFTENIIS